MPAKPTTANRAACLLAASLLAVSLLAAREARAEGPAALYRGGPVYKDLERFDRTGSDRPGPDRPGPDRPGLDRPMIETYGARDPAEDARRRPRRAVNGDAGYVGSDYGLGKPSFTGLGSRPDPFGPD